MKSCAILLVLTGLVSCVDMHDPLVVKQYQLRDQLRDHGEEPMVRMEKERRLRGAISMEERRQRLGQYYTLMWKDFKGVGAGPVEVVFEYRQGASASRIKRMSRRFESSASSGTAEFSVIGDDYFENGKVLAWRATVLRNGKEVAVRRSYLWN